MTHQHAQAKEQNTGSAIPHQCEESDAPTFGATTKRRKKFFLQNRLKGTSTLRSEICYCCKVAFAKVWSPPVLTAPFHPLPQRVQCETTPIAYLTAFREISENSQCGHVAVGRGLGVMYCRRLLSQSHGIVRPMAATSKEPSSEHGSTDLLLPTRAWPCLQIGARNCHAS